MKEFFKELKVVELASVLAGPAAGLFFAELGAEVVKIESKPEGDAIRKWKLPEENASTNESAYYHSVNWNKHTEFLDFNDSNDLVKVHAYLQEADIVLVNFKQGTAKKWSLDNTSLRLAYPSLIIGEIRGFSTSSRLAYDAVLQAETGFMSINGTKDSGPLKMPVAFIDLFAGHQLKEGILVALLQRSRTGKGALVSVSLEESAIASLANQAAAYLNTGVIPSQQGSLHPVIAPYGEIFQTADERYVLLAVGTDIQFSRLCNLLGITELSQQMEFSTNTSRVMNRTALAEILSREIKRQSADALMSELEKEKIPAGLVNNLQQVLEGETAGKMILEQEEMNGISRRIATAVFNIEINP